MNIYTVTTELNGFTIFKGITENIEQYVEKYFPTAEWVDSANNNAYYKYKGHMNDEIKLRFHYQTKDIHLSLHIDGDAKYIL